MSKRQERLADQLLYVTSFVMPFIFLPQIIVLLASKSTTGLSLLTLLLSAGVQSIMLFKAVVSQQRSLLVSVLSSLIPLVLVIGLVLYLRYLYPLF